MKAEFFNEVVTSVQYKVTHIHCWLIILLLAVARLYLQCLYAAVVCAPPPPPPHNSLLRFTGIIISSALQSQQGRQPPPPESGLHVRIYPTGAQGRCWVWRFYDKTSLSHIICSLNIFITCLCWICHSFGQSQQKVCFFLYNTLFLWITDRCLGHRPDLAHPVSRPVISVRKSGIFLSIFCLLCFVKRWRRWLRMACFQNVNQCHSFRFVCWLGSLFFKNRACSRLLQE